MATAVAQTIVYKTQSDYVFAIVKRAYQLSGGVYTDANAVAYTDATVTHADIKITGSYQSTQLTKVAKVTNVGTNGTVTWANIASMAVGTWGVVA